MAAMGMPAAVSDAMKNRRRTTTKSKRPSAPRVRGRRKPSRTNADTKIALLKHERDEALEQFSAASEVLKVISSSPGDLKPVFEAILDNLLRLICTRLALLLLVRDGMLHVAGIKGDPGFEKLAQHYPLPLDDRLLSGKAILTGRALQTVPIIGNPDAPPSTQRLAVDLGYNALISVPLVHEGKVIGVLNTGRRDPIAFTDKQVALIKSFAAQAVIAIENTRLLNELRQRTTDLTESLEQQTATSEVLKVISTSPGELEAVFQSVLEKAVRLCDATFGVMYRYDDRDRTYTAVALFGAPAALQENYVKRGAITPAPASSLDHVARTGGVVNKADASAEPAPGAPVIFGGARSLICVPMTKNSRLIGAITIYRQEVRPFTDKQVELVQRFADQAVIAIENTRLLNELRESLEQQTATSKVLQVISSSPAELEPVFRAILENATRICEAAFGNLFLCDGPIFQAVAAVHSQQSYADYWRRELVDVRDNPGIPLDRIAKSKQVVHISDLSSDPSNIPRTNASLLSSTLVRELLLPCRCLRRVN